MMKSDGINFKEAFALLSENQPSKVRSSKEKTIEAETTVNTQNKLVLA